MTPVSFVDRLDGKPYEEVLKGIEENARVKLIEEWRITKPWTDDYETAYAQAIEKNQPLLVIVEHAEFESGRVEQTRFIQGELYSELIKPYVICRLNSDHPSAVKIIEALKPDQLPFSFITAKGNPHLVFRKTGAYSSDEWISTLQRYRDVSVSAPDDSFMVPTWYWYFNCVKCRGIFLNCFGRCRRH